MAVRMGGALGSGPASYELALHYRKADQPVRLSGRLRAALSFSQIDEILADGALAYVENIRLQCVQAHAAIHHIYFDYPVESAMLA